MQKARWGRNFAASSCLAFALLAPAAAGCASSARAPVPACISQDAGLRESRGAVLSSIDRISGLYGTVLERMRKVEREIELLPPEAYGNITLHFVMDAHLRIVGNALLGLKDTIDRLQAGMADAGEDEGKMRMLALVACAALESAEITAGSCLRILESASSEIRAAGKE